MPESLLESVMIFNHPSMPGYHRRTLPNCLQRPEHLIPKGINRAPITKPLGPLRHFDVYVTDPHRAVFACYSKLSCLLVARPPRELSDWLGEFESAHVRVSRAHK